MNKLLSVITPVYNGEKSVGKTIESVLAQTYTNLEYIIVDDGSIDNSLRVCQEYADKDNRIKIYSQSNKGPSAARNLALENAKGDYVVFIDSDDWIIPTAYEEMIDAALTTGANIVECGYCKEINGEKVSVKECYEKDHFLTGNELREYSLNFIFSTSDKRIRSYMCLRLIERKIIEENKIRFNEKILRSEDYLFLSKLSIKAKGIKLIKSKKLYIYVQNNESITQNYVKNYFNMVLEIYDDLNNYSNILNDNEYKNRVKYGLVHRSQIALYNESKAIDGIGNKLKRIIKILNNPNLKGVVKNIKLKDGIKSFGNSFIIIKFRFAILALVLK